MSLHLTVISDLLYSSYEYIVTALSVLCSAEVFMQNRRVDQDSVLMKLVFVLEYTID